MDLTLLQHYFTFLSELHLKLQNNRHKLQTSLYHSYSFFKLLSPKSAPEVD